MSEMINKVFVLTYEVSDGSAFRLCGVTRNYTVAQAWIAANDLEHKVYDIYLDRIATTSEGHKSW